MTVHDLILSFAAPAILLVLALVFLRRRLYREFPFFFTYVVYSVVVGILRETAIHHRFLYFWLYWISEALFGILALLVLREVFHRLFALSYAAYRWFRLLLPVIFLLILTISMWEMTHYPLGSGPLGRVVSAIYWFDFGVHALEGTILLLVLALTQVFPVAWRRNEFGILTGFGISACITMLADILRFGWGTRYETFFRYGPPIAYVLATMIWLHAFLRPPQTRSQSQIEPDEMLEIVRRSRQLLEKIERALGLRRHILITLV